MAHEQEDSEQLPVAAEEEAPVKYYSWCPHGDLCAKKGKTLGGYWTEARARQAVFNHLRSSSYHMFEQETAQMEADLAHVETHTWDPEKDEDGTWQPPARKRPAPAEPSGPPPSSMARRHRSSAPAESSSASSKASSVVSRDLSSQIHQQTRNAYVFVKANVSR